MKCEARGAVGRADGLLAGAPLMAGISGRRKERGVGGEGT